MEDDYVTNEPIKCSPNSSRDEIWSYIAYYRGAQKQPLDVAIFLTVVNAIIFITGFVGNIAVCFVIIQHRALHTATNYYLLNLAVSDLLLLVFGLPNDVLLYWHQYPWTFGLIFCKFRALVSETASYASVLTILTFSTERFFAICRPLSPYSMSGLRRTIRIISIIWMIGASGALPFCYFITVDYLTCPEGSDNILEDSAYCGIVSLDYPIAEISSILFFGIPMFFLALEHIMMGMQIYRTNTHVLGEGCVHRDEKKIQANRTIVRMLNVVVLAFFISWAPFHLQRLLVIYAADYYELNRWMFFITGILYYLSSTLNPILYNVMSGKMRNAFKEVIFGIKPKKAMMLQRHTTVKELTFSRTANYQKQKISNQIETVIDEINGDDTISLMNKDTITVPTTGLNHNTLIYQIKPTVYNCDVAV